MIYIHIGGFQFCLLVVGFLCVTSVTNDAFCFLRKKSKFIVEEWYTWMYNNKDVEILIVMIYFRKIEWYNFGIQKINSNRKVLVIIVDVHGLRSFLTIKIISWGCFLFFLYFSTGTYGVSGIKSYISPWI